MGTYVEVEKATNLVIKVGSSILQNKVNMATIAHQIWKHFEDRRIILVSSGAIVRGSDMLNIRLNRRSLDIVDKQALSSIGQRKLMYDWYKVFSNYDMTISQILLTNAIKTSPEVRNNAINTLNKLLDWGVLPVINENDSVSTKEIMFGDNDFLAAEVTKMMGFDLLIILTDVIGLKNERGSLVTRVEDINKEIGKLRDCNVLDVLNSGMISKLQAAAELRESKISTVIASGKNPEVLEKIFTSKFYTLIS